MFHYANFNLGPEKFIFGIHSNTPIINVDNANFGDYTICLVLFRDSAFVGASQFSIKKNYCINSTLLKGILNREDFLKQMVNVEVKSN